MALTSIRLDDETTRILDRLARERNVSRSRLIREAISGFVAVDRKAEFSPYASVRDLIGKVRGGPPDLSARTGAKVREMLVRRHRNAQR